MKKIIFEIIANIYQAMSKFFIHPSSDVQTKKIGIETVIWQYVVVLKGAVIGKNCNLNSHTFVENDVIIGDNVTLKCGVYVWDGTIIEDNVFIGSNASLIAPIKLAKSSIVGAGSVITQSVKEKALAVERNLQKTFPN